MSTIIYYLKNPKYVFKKIIWFFQRIFRGYSNCDLWGLDYHLAKLILKRLIAFRKMNKAGIPCCLFSKEEIEYDFKEDKTDLWNEIIDKMIWSFEYVLSDYGMDMEKIMSFKDKENIIKDSVQASIDNIIYNKELHEKYSKQYEEGMQLFSEHFANLWD